MSSTLKRSVSKLVIAGALLGSVGCATFATHEEYAAYRNARLTQDRNARLEAVARYNAAYPDGFWHDDLAAEQSSYEEQVWAETNATRDGLQFYLSVYPQGTYAEQATQRLAALSTVQERREEEHGRVEEVRQEQRAQAAEDRRVWVSRAVEFWARTLVGIRNYGQPISAVARAHPEFSQAFGQAPAPACSPRACLKHYHAHYAIPVPGATRIEREMHVFLRILMDRGRVQRVEVLLPNKGFSRWFELENRTLVTDEDPEQRMAAIEWALQRLEPVLTQAAVGARAIDVIPEPIAPISEAAQQASTRAGEADTTTVPGGAAPAAPAQPAAPQASAQPPASGEGGGIDALLEQAVGGAGQPVEQPQVMPEEPPPDTSALVLPIGLRALQRGNVRIVVFAAGEEDYAEGYDGFYVELARD